MSKRLQVVLPEAEIDRYARTAEAEGLTLSEWVRQVLRRAGLERTAGKVDERLAAVRVASRHQFPVAAIETMLAEVDRGYRAAADP